ncbi:lantibiotic dehydratase [Streptomyces sp. R39]|uniref:Lantibiotic dehydratase n=1 Tax=Streptomyces sp. R39 TaxID=3238631 RepID=A0AB39QIK0_9ACTN
MARGREELSAVRGRPAYRAMEFGMVRMPLFRVRDELPRLDAMAVEVATDTELTAFLAAAYDHAVLREAVAVSAPALGDVLDRVARGEQLSRKQLRKAAISVTRYALRAGTRSTPFGLFAGVAPVVFGETASVRVGPHHTKHARLDGAWLDGLLRKLEQRPDVLRCLDVVINDSCVQKGDHLHVPLRSTRGRRSGAPASGRVVVRARPLVLAAVAGARRPIGFLELLGRLGDLFPDAPAPRLEDTVARLVRAGVLLTSLAPPLDSPDPLGHVLRQIEGVPGLPVRSGLRGALTAFAAYRRSAMGQGFPELRAAVDAVDPSYAPGGSPVQVDLRADARITLPRTVADEAAQAVSLLWRIAPATGRQHAALRDYRERFVERYGREAAVPLVELLDPERGLGVPQWRLEPADRAREPGPDEAEAARERSMALAELAWPVGGYAPEVELTGELADRLTRVSSASPSPTAEVRFELLAADADAVDRGDFRLVVRGGSQQAGALFGRFAHVLPELDGPLRHAVTAGVPGGRTPAQLCFQAPSGLAYSVANTPRLTGQVVSVGEFRAVGQDVFRADELAVGVHEDGLRLFSAVTGDEIHLVNTNALSAPMATGPAARFLREMSIENGRTWAEWDWGPFARAPRLPRIRHGRSILAPERWRPTVEMRDAAGDWRRWKAAFDVWRAVYEVPRTVQVGSRSDYRLALDLDRPSHQRLLHEELRCRPWNRIEESLATADTATGWTGGSSAELVVPLRAAEEPSPRRTSGPRTAVVPVAHSMAGGWLFAKIYSSTHLHEEILADRLPLLIEALGDAVDRWFFIRYADPAPHLRLRLHGTPEALRESLLPRLGDWVRELGGLGLAADWALSPYRPETGRYGGAGVLADAEAVFQADSEVAVTQLSLARRKALGTDTRMITALNLVALARGASGQDWADWLLRVIPRDCHREAFRERRAELRGLLESDGEVLAKRCGGAELAAAWEKRDRALARYAAQLRRQPSGPEPGERRDLAVRSLMHMHHNRAVGTDRDSERAVHALARGFAELTVAAERFGPGPRTGNSRSPDRNSPTANPR